MKRDTFELIQALEGSIEPCAEGHIDSKHLANLKEWCELHDKIMCELMDCAKSDSLRCYGSAREIIDYARQYLTEIYEWLDDYVSEWNERDSDCLF